MTARGRDYDVLADGIVVGRIMKAAAAPVGSPWLWTLGYGRHKDRTPTHVYEPTREAAMPAFAKSWRRGIGPRCHWRKKNPAARARTRMRGLFEHPSSSRTGA